MQLHNESGNADILFCLPDEGRKGLRKVIRNPRLCETVGGWTSLEEDGERAGPRNEPDQASRVRQGIPFKSDRQAESELGEGQASRMQDRGSKWSASGL